MDETGLSAFVSKHFPWSMRPAIFFAGAFAVSLYLSRQGLIDDPPMDIDAPISEFVLSNWWVFSGFLAFWSAILGAILTAAVGWMNAEKLYVWPSFLVTGILLFLSFAGAYAVWGVAFVVVSLVWGLIVLPLFRKARQVRNRNLSVSS